MSTTTAGSAQDGRKVGEVPSFDVTLRIRRYNPEVSDEVRWDEFKLTMYGTHRVLDALAQRSVETVSH